MAKRKSGILKTEIKTLTNPNRWDQTHGTYLAGRAHLDGADAVAAEMDGYWGVDRLRLLVPPEVRERFDRQRYLFNQAILNGDLEAVRVQSARMIAGWMACNKLAIAAGATRLDKQVMEVALDDGTVVAIVPDAIRASLVRAEGREVTIYTLQEIGHLLSLASLKAVVKAKEIWPGAKVAGARVPSDPLQAIDHPSGFDTPFNSDEIVV